MKQPRRLSASDIDALVERYQAGEAPLDHLVNAALWGRNEDRPRMWRDWPKHAREAWELAIRRDREIAAWGVRTPIERGQTREHLTLKQAWDAIEAAAPDPARWWELPNVTWSDLRLPDAFSMRTIHYQLVDCQGWMLRGRGRHRRVIAAPCVQCGTKTHVSYLERRLCPTCRKAH